MTTTSIRQRIEDRLNLVEQMLILQQHLSDPAEVLDALASVSKFYSVLSEEQREFVQAARWATDSRNVWKLESA
jgi:hypothetical protein